jgi:hypothetical protein
MNFFTGADAGIGHAQAANDEMEGMGLYFIRTGLLVAALGCLLSGHGWADQAPRPAKDIMAEMLTHERYEAAHLNHYAYISREKSSRTGWHLWTEKVVETTAGKVRMLVAEDGQPLSGDRLAAEKRRLAAIEAHPEIFQRQERSRQNDEQHAREMLELAPRAFLITNVHQDGEFLRIDLRPDPNYVPQSMEEKVMHGMMVSMQVDPRSARLHKLEGRLPQDVNIGFGLLATIRAGSAFSMKRDPAPGNQWKTTAADTDINGTVIFFKSIGKKAHIEHSGFKQIPTDLTVAQAVQMLEK